MRAVDAAERERPARLHRDLPEQHLAEPVEHLLHVVGVADRDPAARHHDVGCRGRRCERGFDIFRPIAHDAHVDHLATEVGQHAEHRVAVRIEDLARAGRAAELHEFVAGREERDAQPAVHRDLDHADRREHPEFGGAHALSLVEHDGAGLQILAGLADVLPGLRAGAERDVAVGRLRTLLHDHRVAIRRDDGAREDAHGLAGVHGTGVRPAGERGPDDAQRDVGVRLQVGVAHRVAVHPGVVVRGHIDRRDDVLGEDAAERVADVEALDGRDRREEGADVRARLIDGHRVGIVVVGGGDGAEGGRGGHGVRSWALGVGCQAFGAGCRIGLHGRRMRDCGCPTRPNSIADARSVDRGGHRMHCLQHDRLGRFGINRRCSSSPPSAASPSRRCGSRSSGHRGPSTPGRSRPRFPRRTNRCGGGCAGRCPASRRGT